MNTNSMANISGADIVRESIRSRFGLLAVTLVLAILVPTILPNTRIIAILFTPLSTTVLLSGLYAVATERRHFIIGAAMIVPAIMTDWGSKAVESNMMQAAGGHEHIARLYGSSPVLHPAERSLRVGFSRRDSSMRR